MNPANHKAIQFRKSLDTIHKYTEEEEQVLLKAKVIQMDPRFVGTFQQALDVAIELHVGVVPDPNAMRRSR